MASSFSKFARRAIAPLAATASALLLAGPALSAVLANAPLANGLAEGPSQACLATMLAGVALVYRGAGRTA
ncbi:MAG: hypothetical protein WCO82_05435 [Sphingomonadales bacterium]|jgi:hypothetical protein